MPKSADAQNAPRLLVGSRRTEPHCLQRRYSGTCCFSTQWRAKSFVKEKRFPGETPVSPRDSPCDPCPRCLLIVDDSNADDRRDALVRVRVYTAREAAAGEDPADPAGAQPQIGR